MPASVTKARDTYLQLDPTASMDLICITVSFDGSLHKRGHTSMYGVAAVIDVLTGLVVYYVVLFKYCHACITKKTTLGAESEPFNAWQQGHAGQCAINYDGSSNASFNIIFVML